MTQHNITPQPDAAIRMLAAATAAMLHAVQPLLPLSWLLGAICLACTNFTGLSWLGLPLLSGSLISLAVTYWALRARLDARLFDALCAALAAGQSGCEALAQLDQALLQLGLIRKSTARSLQQRIPGARRLAVLMVGGIIAQLGLMMCAALLIV